MIDAELTAWVDGCLGRAGRERTGELALFRSRTWSDVYCAPTHEGTVWLKVCPPATAFEPRLYGVLADLVPDRILVPLGRDDERGWLLLPDGGPSVADRDGGEQAMAAALPAYARLQQTVAPHVERVLACGAEDMRPDMLPRRFEEALAAVVPYVERRANEKERADYDRLTGLRDSYTAWCAELAGSDVPASIDHNDLHAENVLDGPRFYDWGDSVVAHPFASLLLVDEHYVPATYDAYLAEFGDVAALRPVAALAIRVGSVARALVWHRALAHDPDHEHALAPLWCLRRMLREPP